MLFWGGTWYLILSQNVRVSEEIARSGYSADLAGIGVLCSPSDTQLARYNTHSLRYPSDPATARFELRKSGAVQDAPRHDSRYRHACPRTGIGVDVVEQARAWSAALYYLAFKVWSGGSWLDRAFLIIDLDTKDRVAELIGQLMQSLLGFLSIHSPNLFGGSAKARQVYKYHRLSGYFLITLLLATAHLGGAHSTWALGLKGANTKATRVVAFWVGAPLLLVAVFMRMRYVQADTTDSTDGQAKQDAVCT